MSKLCSHKWLHGFHLPQLSAPSDQSRDKDPAIAVLLSQLPVGVWDFKDSSQINCMHCGCYLKPAEGVVLLEVNILSLAVKVAFSCAPVGLQLVPLCQKYISFITLNDR